MCAAQLHRIIHSFVIARSAHISTGPTSEDSTRQMENILGGGGDHIIP
jgi:hypothetical protein